MNSTESPSRVGELVAERREPRRRPRRPTPARRGAEVALGELVRGHHRTVGRHPVVRGTEPVDLGAVAAPVDERRRVRSRRRAAGTAPDARMSRACTRRPTPGRTHSRHAGLRAGCAHGVSPCGINESGCTYHGPIADAARHGTPVEIGAALGPDIEIVLDTIACPSSTNRKPGSSWHRSSTRSTASTSRPRKLSNVRYHSRSQWVCDTSAHRRSFRSTPRVWRAGDRPAHTQRVRSRADDQLTLPPLPPCRCRPAHRRRADTRRVQQLVGLARSRAPPPPPPASTNSASTTAPASEQPLRVTWMTGFAAPGTPAKYNKVGVIKVGADEREERARARARNVGRQRVLRAAREVDREHGAAVGRCGRSSGARTCSKTSRCSTRSSSTRPPPQQALRLLPRLPQGPEDHAPLPADPDVAGRVREAVGHERRGRGSAPRDRRREGRSAARWCSAVTRSAARSSPPTPRGTSAAAPAPTTSPASSTSTAAAARARSAPRPRPRS